jgi:type I protein arginine methyltransferase
LVTTYSISQYGSMIEDRVRVDSYAQALRRAIRPGSVVLDIGTGTGIFALLACKYGAGRVYAVDPSEAIELARQMAVTNGMSDRIVFIQDLSTRTTLPELVDVLVSNIGGVLPFLEQHLPSIMDARRRFLKPGGALIPLEDRLFAAIVEAPDVYRRHMLPWENNPYDLDLTLGREIMTSTWIKQRVKPDQLLVEPALCQRIDYRTVESAGFSAELGWKAVRAGTAHGLSLWFDSTLAEGISFSNAPAAPEMVFGAAFFPLRTPVRLAIGDTVSVKLRATLVGDDYVWNWDTVAAASPPQGETISSFEQSTFFADPTSPTQLKKRAAHFRPVRNIEGEIDFAVLGLMNGNTRLEQIAEELILRFPGRFKDLQEALARAGEISQGFAKP